MCEFFYGECSVMASTKHLQCFRGVRIPHSPLKCYLDMGFGNEHCKDIVENICPYCGEKLIMNKRSFANHVRWCKKNPRYEEILKSTKEKLPKSSRKEYKLNCIICNKEYTVVCTDGEYESGKYKKTCSTECSHKLSYLNSNIVERNEKISKSLRIERYKKICPYCGKEFETIRKTQVCCSFRCGRKYRDIKKYKLTNEFLCKYYKKLCCFNFSLNSYPDEFDFSLIEKYGWYKAKNRGDNLNGISRDHIYSRNKGFENLIDPYIISHPANCQLLRHNDNASKHSDCDIELESLIEKLKKWNQKYGEYPNTIDYTIFEKSNICFIKFDDLVKK